MKKSILIILLLLAVVVGVLVFAAKKAPSKKGGTFVDSIQSGEKVVGGYIPNWIKGAFGAMGGALDGVRSDASLTFSTKRDIAAGTLAVAEKHSAKKSATPSYVSQPVTYAALILYSILAFFFGSVFLFYVAVAIVVFFALRWLFPKMLRGLGRLQIR